MEKNWQKKRQYGLGPQDALRDLNAILWSDFKLKKDVKVHSVL